MYEVVYAKLIELCTDICKRKCKKKLLWFGDKDKSLNYEPKDDEMLITVHRWFDNKSCLGDWLYARLGDLAAKVTAQLGGGNAEVIPSGNTWSGSTWDGSSVYTKKTQEQNADGSYVTITADFRRYSCVEDSIADHSAYLIGAKNGSKLRYEGLKGCTDYKKAAQNIKNGGYATSLTYVDKLCSIIERRKLTQYDVAGEASDVVKYYRVRKSWEDAKSQLGAYTVLANAKAMADKNPGYEVYDWNGK